MINKRNWDWMSDGGWENWRLTFGKHKGKRLADIVIENPKYVIWLSQASFVSQLDRPRVEAAAMAALSNASQKVQTPRREKKSGRGQSRKSGRRR